MTLTIALDCDGVLADFDTAVRKLAHTSRRSWLSRLLSKKADSETELEKLFDGAPNMWAAIADAGEEFHKTMPAFAGAIGAVNDLRAIGNVIVATSPPSSCHGWLQHRTRWLQDHFMFKRSEIIFAPGKQFVRADVLVDDLPRNLDNWPGIRILVKRAWNDADTMPTGAFSVSGVEDVPAILTAALSVR